MSSRVIVIGFYRGPVRIRGRMREHVPIVVGMRLGTEDEVPNLARLIKKNARRHNDWLEGVSHHDVLLYTDVVVYDGEGHDRYGFPRWLGPASDWERE